MSMINGRSDDYAIYENGLMKSPRNFLGLFDPLVKFLHEYQIIQERIDKFTVRVVPNNSFNEKIEQKIKENLLKEFPDSQIDIKLVNEIQRDKSGKFRAFISKVNSSEV